MSGCPPSALLRDRETITPHAEQYTSCTVSFPWRPFFSAINMKSAECTPRFKAVQTLSWTQKERRGNMKTCKPIYKFAILSTPIAGNRRTIECCTCKTCLLEVATEEFAEAQVLVLANKPPVERGTMLLTNKLVWRHLVPCALGSDGVDQFEQTHRRESTVQE